MYKHQKSKLVAAASLAFAIAGCSALVDNGPVEQQPRDLPAFTGLSSQGSIDTLVTIGSPQKIVVEAEKNIQPKIRTEVVGDTLEIGSKGSFATSKGVKVHITVPNLQSLSLSGSGDVSLHGATGPSLQVAISGSGEALVQGKVDKLQAAVNGSGELEGFGLETNDATVDVSGSGEVEVFAVKTLQATVSGSGDITYRGDPKVTQTVSGSGEVRQAP